MVARSRQKIGLSEHTRKNRSSQGTIDAADCRIGGAAMRGKRCRPDKVSGRFREVEVPLNRKSFLLY
jgi:hypothetical protein